MRCILPDCSRSRFFDQLVLLIAAVVVLNAVDGVLTILLTLSSEVEEVNPLMARLINSHPALFMSCKAILVSLGSVILWRHQHNIVAVFSILLAFLTYYATLLYQLRLIHSEVVWSLLR